MGNNCATIQTINRANDANATNIESRSRGFCGHPVVNTQNNEFCESIGDREWIRGERGSACNYASGGRLWNATWGVAFCGNEQIAAGRTVTCNRTRYRGEPDICLLRDAICTQENVFDDDTNMRSCPLDRRDLSNAAGRSLIESICLPSPNNPNWINNWVNNRTVLRDHDQRPTGGRTSGRLAWTSPSNPVCLHALYRNIYGTNGFGCRGVAPPNIEAGIQALPDASGMIWARGVVDRLITTYINQGGNLVSREDQIGNNVMNDLLWEICSTVPGVCSNSLQQVCSNVTTQDMIRTPELQKWCGCYMPDFEYARYTNLYRINKECTPMCNRQGIIPLVNETGVNLQTCRQNTCVIDDVSIQLNKASVTNGITFTQVCGSCGQNGICQCTLTGLNFAAVQTTVPSLNISQQCGSGSTCYHETTNQAGNTRITPIPCSSPEGFVPYLNNNLNEARSKADRIINFKIILFIALIVVILMLIWYFAISSLKNYDFLFPVQPILNT